MTLVNIRILRHVKSKSLSFISMRTIKKKSTIKLLLNFVTSDDFVFTAMIFVLELLIFGW